MADADFHIGREIERLSRALDTHLLDHIVGDHTHGEYASHDHEHLAEEITAPIVHDVVEPTEHVAETIVHAAEAPVVDTAQVAEEIVSQTTDAVGEVQQAAEEAIDKIGETIEAIPETTAGIVGDVLPEREPQRAHFLDKKIF